VTDVRKVPMTASGELPSTDGAIDRVARAAAFLRAVLDAVPSPVFVVEGDMRIQQVNDPASGAAGAGRALGDRVGDYLGCTHSLEGPEGCGSAPACLECAIRRSARAAFGGRRVVRERATLELQREDRIHALHLLVTASPFEHDARDFVMLLLEDVGELLELRSMIPICSYCKKIRNDEQYWQRLETYFKSHLDVDFTHGICPDCMERLERLEREEPRGSV
jgi:hypothetical protein